MALEDKVSLCPKCGKDRYLFKPEVQPSVDLCDFCGAKLLHTNLTAEECFLIEHISKDRDFLLAMIELKENDIIEYQTKISQFRQQAKADGCYTNSAEKEKQNKPKCPMCGSTEFTPVRRKFSLLTGFATNKTELICNKCGTRVR